MRLVDVIMAKENGLAVTLPEGGRYFVGDIRYFFTQDGSLRIPLEKPIVLLPEDGGPPMAVVESEIAGFAPPPDNEPAPIVEGFAARR